MDPGLGQVSSILVSPDFGGRDSGRLEDGGSEGAMASPEKKEHYWPFEETLQDVFSAVRTITTLDISIPFSRSFYRD